MKRNYIIFFLCFVAHLLVAQTPAPQFWQQNQSPGLDDLIWDNTWFNHKIDNGSGNWNATEANWSPNSIINVKWNPCRNAIFGGNSGVGVAGNVTLSATMNTRSLYFRPANGNFVLQGGGITTAPCTTSLRLDVANGLNPYIFTPLAGTNALNKENTGTAYLLGTNTYTGTTAINAGMLSVGNFADNPNLFNAGSVPGGNRNPLVLNPGYNGLYFSDGNYYSPAYLPTVPANDGDVIFFSRGSTSGLNIAIDRTNLTSQLYVNNGTTAWFRYDAASNLWISMGLTTAQPSIAGSSNVVINSQGTMQWDNNATNATITLANSISGTGTLKFQGQNAINNRVISGYQLTGNNSGFSGNLMINRCRLQGVSSPNYLGNSTIYIQDRGSVVFGSNTFSNTIVVEDQSGWHDDQSGDTVIGALRLEGATTLTGNIILNNPTNTVLGDATCKYAAIGSWDAGTHTISAVISGNGNLSMSRFTGYRGGTPQTVNIKLSGTNSNTFQGKVVVNGQGANANLLLMKTGGAIAIPSNTIVEMGNNTGAQANLRMGDDQNTGATTGTARNQWDNQFGDNVLMDFKNASGQWIRFDLQGTNQTLAGVISGNLTTQGGAVIQNQNTNSFNINNPATLTLNGSNNYLYNSYLRDQDNNGTVNKLNIIKNGTGIQIFAGANISYTGTTVVNNGILSLYNASSNKSTSYVVTSGGRLDFNVSSASNASNSPYFVLNSVNATISGTGTVTLEGLQSNDTNGFCGFGGGGGKGAIFQMSTGGLLSIHNGSWQWGWSNGSFATNQGDLEVASGAEFRTSDLNNQFNKITGDGVIANAYSGTINITIGVGGGSSTFNGIIKSGDAYNAVTTGAVNIIKAGAGIITLSGNNTYIGGTTINGGVLKAGNINAFGTSAITINAGGTLDKGGFTITNTIINNGGIIIP